MPHPDRFSGPSYYFHQDLGYDVTVDLRLFPNLHSEMAASVPASTGDMRPSCSSLGSLLSPSSCTSQTRTYLVAVAMGQVSLFAHPASLRQIYSDGRDRPQSTHMSTAESRRSRKPAHRSFLDRVKQMNPPHITSPTSPNFLFGRSPWSACAHTSRPAGDMKLVSSSI